MEHHHWIWIISRSGSTSLDWIWIITRSVSSLLDLYHHYWIWIITRYGSSLAVITGSGSSLDLDHHWCYLMILLVIGISIDPALFHVSCMPSLHVGIIQHLYLINTWSNKGSSFLSYQHMIEDRYCTYIWSTHDLRKEHPLFTSDLLIRKEHPTLTSNHVGTNPIIISERPITYIWLTHDWRKAQHFYLTNT